MTPEEADGAQQWAGMDGATAWHLIERHAENWHEIGELMNAWLRANMQRIEAMKMEMRAQEIENFRRWAFADDGAATDQWQAGYDAARDMVRALLPANALADRREASASSDLLGGMD